MESTNPKKLAAVEDVDYKDVIAQADAGDAELEKRVQRKLDRHILPWIFIIWLLAFIDRSNIGMSSLQSDCNTAY